MEINLNGLNPTRITGWLECEHSLKLHRLHPNRKPQIGAFARLVQDKGVQHEREVLKRYRATDPGFLDLTHLNDVQPMEERVRRAREEFLSTDASFVFQLPLTKFGMFGICDFVIRVEEPAEGFSPWEPVDAKLARSEGKPGHLLQLCFYADAIEDLTGLPPKYVHIELGSGERETFELAEYRAYWKMILRELSATIAQEPALVETVAEPCDFCQYCTFQGDCEQEWRNGDSLVNVADIRSTDRATLEGIGISTIQGLAEADPELLDDTNPRLRRRQAQARLQKEAEAAAGDTEHTIPWRRIVPDDPDERVPWGRGFAKLPPPDPGDVFFDIEGDPLWTPQRGLIFLFGLLVDDGDGWTYQQPIRWAHDRDEELRAAQELIDYLIARREIYPAMHVYHYNSTERTVLKDIVEGTSDEERLHQLFDTGFFVDLHLEVFHNAVQAGVESYGLKAIGKVISHQRATKMEAGSGAVLEYNKYFQTGDSQHLDDIAAYNEDDVRETLAVRDWLLTKRNTDDPWRAVALELLGDTWSGPEAELVDEFRTFPAGSSMRLLGDVLHYWHREDTKARVDAALDLQRDAEDLFESKEHLAKFEVTNVEKLESERPTIRVHFSWPDQPMDPERTHNDREQIFVLVGPYARMGFELKLDLDERTGSFKIDSEETNLDLGIAFTKYSIVDSKTLLGSVCDIARQALGQATTKPVRPVAFEILDNARPRFTADYKLPDDGFPEALDDLVQCALSLDNSYLVIQGPPGTGKTYTGAQLAIELAKKDKVVGVVSTSHDAVRNFLEEVMERAEERNWDSTGTVGRFKLNEFGQTKKSIAVQARPDGMFSTKNKLKVRWKYQINGGALRLFCSPSARDFGVDYLIIDEAGQVSLADALAVSASATNVILLGDPQQLPHVSQAAHPQGADSSVLTHLIGDHAVIPRDRGTLLRTSFRMAPSICSFISRTFYGGELHHAQECTNITLAEPPGLGTTWIAMSHSGRSDESIEEARKTQEIILDLLGREWTDRYGQIRSLGASSEDFLVVAPFNKQRELISKVLSEHPETAQFAGSVGTVNKFQGQQAAVVIFSVTSSSIEDAPRDLSFNLDRSRFNVAISRAKTHAYLLCTTEILTTRARSIEDMARISTLNSFAESAKSVAPVEM